MSVDRSGLRKKRGKDPIKRPTIVSLVIIIWKYLWDVRGIEELNGASEKEKKWVYWSWGLGACFILSILTLFIFGLGKALLFFIVSSSIIIFVPKIGFVFYLSGINFDKFLALLTIGTIIPLTIYYFW